LNLLGAFSAYTHLSRYAQQIKNVGLAITFASSAPFYAQVALRGSARSPRRVRRYPLRPSSYSKKIKKAQGQASAFGALALFLFFARPPPLGGATRLVLRPALVVPSASSSRGRSRWLPCSSLSAVAGARKARLARPLEKRKSN
jgi:hypothetical protein